MRTIDTLWRVIQSTQVLIAIVVGLIAISGFITSRHHNQEQVTALFSGLHTEMETNTDIFKNIRSEMGLSFSLSAGDNTSISSTFLNLILTSPLASTSISRKAITILQHLQNLTMRYQTLNQDAVKDSQPMRPTITNVIPLFSLKKQILTVYDSAACALKKKFPEFNDMCIEYKIGGGDITLPSLQKGPIHLGQL